jgi:hypothetical protein
VITSVEHGKAARTNSFLLLGEEHTRHTKRFEDETIEVKDAIKKTTEPLEKE